jgi:hypothetical protein
MADQLQLRGGTTAQHATFTGALREVTVDTDKKTVVVHDGSTAGGNPLLRQDLSNLPAGTIDNADINASAGIVDTKLATISTAGKVSNSATTATNANTASAIVARDGSGNFTANTITAALTGAASSNVLKAGDTMTGNLTVPSLNGGPLAGFRNRIINGHFDFWQRGTSFTLSTSFQYTADRWRAKVGTGGAGSIVRNISTTNQPYLTLAITTAGTGTHELSQPIEFVRSVSDDGGPKPVSVSFNLARSSGTGTVDVSLLQYFGSGGSPSGSVSLSLGTITPTGTVTRYTLSGTLASIAGKTFGTNNDDQLVLVFTPSNAVATYDFSAIQVEQGTVATPFERRSYGQELSLAKRYYQLGGGLGAVYQGGATATFSFQAKLEPEMRAAPTASVFNGTTAVVQNGRPYSNINSISLVINSTSQSVYMTVVSSDTGMTSNASGEVSGRAIAFTSEL